MPPIEQLPEAEAQTADKANVGSSGGTAESHASKLTLNVGALGPTIAEQVAAQGFITKMPAERLDRAEHAIHLLRIQGLLTHAESDRALKRLIKGMQPTAAGVQQ